MSIVLQELNFFNMFSYGENNKIIFNNLPICQLSGKNGNGKSAISLILQELLYSKNIKGIKKGDLLNRNIKANKYGGSVKFLETATNNQYEVNVVRQGATSKVVFLENNIDISEHKIPDTYKKIQSILKLDFELFSQLTYQSSTDLLDFLKATDTNRKKFLINLFNLDKYIEIGEKIKSIISTTEKEEIGLNGELKAVESFLETNRIIDKKLEIEVPSIDNSLIDEKKKLEIAVATYRQEATKIDKNNLYIKERNELQFDIALQKPIEPTEDLKNYTETVLEINTIENNIRNIKKQIEQVKITDTCYVCGQAIDNTKQKQLKQDLENSLSDNQILLDNTKLKRSKLKEIVDTHSNDKIVFDNNKKTLEKFEQLSQLIDSSLPITIDNISEIENKLKEVSSKLTIQISNNNKAITHNEDVRIFNAKVEATKEKNREFLARQQLLKNDIIKIRSKISRLQVLKKAFSTTGIVAFKLENLTKELEDTINEYLQELSDGKFSVVFRLEGEKLNIIVINAGEEAPIETVSGGEFSRIQTSILLSIRQVLSHLGGNHINLLFLDEIMSVLDDTGKEKLIDVLMKEKDLNVFLVSHEYEHPLIEKITINKKNNISYIE